MITSLEALALASLAGLPTAEWRQYAEPEQAGFSSEGLMAVWELAEGARSGAVFVVSHGHVLAAWGEVERRFECHSVRKSLVGALVGRAVESGALELETTLAELGVDDLQGLSDEEKRATVVDLVRSRSGVYHPAAKEPASMQEERPARGSFGAGEVFFYNNWDFNLLGTLYERATGRELFAAFHADIAAPLGMQDFRPQDGFAELAPSSSRYPAHAFRLSARDLARFGQLYLQEGEWRGENLVSADWVRESTRAHSDLGGGRGYGLLWWTYAAGSAPGHPELNRHDHFAAIGTGGQLVLVVPGAELVFVHRGDTDNRRHVPGPQVWAVAERVLAARTGTPAAEPELAEVRVEPLGAPGAEPPDVPPLALEPAALEELVGEYAFPAFRVEAFLHGGRLFARRDDGQENELLPLSPTRFRMWFPPMEVEFVRDGEGPPERARLHTGWGVLTGKREAD